MARNKKRRGKRPVVKLRPFIFWPHLIAGVTAGAVILTMSVTGVLLAYERQILAWADRQSVASRLSPTGTRLSPEALISRVQAAEPDATVTGVTLRSGAAEPASVVLVPNRALLVDPYTGAILGEGSRRIRAFFRTVTDLHRWLALGGSSRPTGRAITGWSNLLFLFIVCSGIYLWFPRKWGWARVRPVTLFERGLRGKARDFNWHNVLGVWSAIPLFLVVITAVPISFPWGNALVYRLVGEEPPRPNPPPGGGPARQTVPDGPRRDAGRRTAPTDGLDALWARAEQQVSDWQSINLRLPASLSAPVVFAIDRGNGGQPQLRSQLTFDRKTGSVTKWEPFASQTLGRRIRSLSRFTHTGEAFGVTGQTVAMIASAGGAVLVYTGLALALRRFVAWRKRIRATHQLERHREEDEAVA
ncbi:MAG TPA: PepSY-associated TM helix domain-containing protein [Vicinamibacterales bacterium]|nr:PepSY-associated TM helix domain-containing protein [Vicinamibacterales bacterium]